MLEERDRLCMELWHIKPQPPIFEAKLSEYLNLGVLFSTEWFHWVRERPHYKKLIEFANIENIYSSTRIVGHAPVPLKVKLRKSGRHIIYYAKPIAGCYYPQQDLISFPIDPPGPQKQIINEGIGRARTVIDFTTTILHECTHRADYFSECCDQMKKEIHSSKKATLRGLADKRYYFSQSELSAFSSEAAFLRLHLGATETDVVQWALNLVKTNLNKGTALSWANQVTGIAFDREFVWL